jgi:hypothetical protein
MAIAGAMAMRNRSGGPFLTVVTLVTSMALPVAAHSQTAATRTRRPARDGSTAMNSIVRFGLHAAAAAILSVAAPRGAQAFSFNETIVVHPIVQNTFVMGVTHDDH